MSGNWLILLVTGTVQTPFLPFSARGRLAALRDTAIEALLAEAKAIITRLDAAFLNQYRLDPVKTAAWKAASRVERDPRRSTPPAEPPVTPPPTP